MVTLLHWEAYGWQKRRCHQEINCRLLRAMTGWIVVSDLVPVSGAVWSCMAPWWSVYFPYCDHLSRWYVALLDQCCCSWSWSLARSVPLSVCAVTAVWSAVRPGATRMAGRRSCVNSLWSGTERVRIGERIKATLAGVLELQALRCKHLEMVDAALEDRGPAATNAVDSRAVEEESGTPESAAKHGSATPRRQQVSQHRSIHDQIIKYGCRDDGDLPTSQSLWGSVTDFIAAW